MEPAKQPPADPMAQKLMIIDACSQGLTHARISNLPRFLRSGDVLVVNDAATFPGSLRAASDTGRRYEIRLLSHRSGTDWIAVLFGDGDWRTPTELRPAVEAVQVGTRLSFADRLSAEVIWGSQESGRLVRIRFRQDMPSMWSAIYRVGRPIQYSYLYHELDLWSVQTAYGSRPWAAEMPSAGRPLRWELLRHLMRQDIRVSRLTHETGLSSTGDEVLDRMLPLPERFEIPESTVTAIHDAKNRGGRIVAVGTSVVRALEGSMTLRDGRLIHGSGETDLKLRKGYKRQVVDGILTGIHDPSDSHFRLLEAFADSRLLRQAHADAEENGYRSHEFGDSCLILTDTNMEMPLAKVA
jgi:S-adenosylmethionine:tRNA ribosyltransferase-isomerase